VRFPTQDNLLIVGAYTPPPNRKGERAPMVILLHMYASDHTAFDRLVPHLHAAGFAVLAIDLRGHGESVGPPEMGLAERVADRDRKLFAAMDRDVAGAYGWLVKQPEVDAARFVLVGASVGCSVALKYAARDRSVDGVVCLTPGTGYMGIDSLSDARKYGRRSVLLLASEEERTACDELGRLLAGAVVQIGPSVGQQDRMAHHGTGCSGRFRGLKRRSRLSC
jgi:alpha-beta hydrolase superfamily lysophospholipase